MPRKKLFVKKLSKSEILTLEQGHKHGNSPDFRLRCQILLISQRGLEVRKIAEALEINPQTVYSTIKSWEKKGLGGLLRKKGQGRKPILELDNPNHVNAAKKAIEKHAQNQTLILEELSSELDIGKCSERSLKRFLKKLTSTDKDFNYEKRKN